MKTSWPKHSMINIHRNKGHILSVPQRHISSYFEATPEEVLAIDELISRVKTIFDKRYKPDGCNVGVNVGAAAGQTVFHLHVHVIPRYQGDVPDPRGGIRRI